MKRILEIDDIIGRTITAAYQGSPVGDITLVFDKEYISISVQAFDVNAYLCTGHDSSQTDKLYLGIITKDDFDRARLLERRSRAEKLRESDLAELKRLKGIYETEI